MVSDKELVKRGTHIYCPFCKNAILKEAVYCTYCKKPNPNTEAKECPTCKRPYKKKTKLVEVEV